MDRILESRAGAAGGPSRAAERAGDGRRSLLGLPRPAQRALPRAARGRRPGPRRAGVLRCGAPPGGGTGGRPGPLPGGHGLGEFTVGESAAGRPGGTRSLPVALAFDDAGGKPAGVVALGLGLDWLGEHFKAKAWPPGNSVSIIDRAGTILVRSPNPELAGGQIPDAFRWMLTAARPGTTEGTSPDGVVRVGGYVPPAAGDGAPGQRRAVEGRGPGRPRRRPPTGTCCSSPRPWPWRCFAAAGAGAGWSAARSTACWRWRRAGPAATTGLAPALVTGARSWAGSAMPSTPWRPRSRSARQRCVPARSASGSWPTWSRTSSGPPPRTAPSPTPTSAGSSIAGRAQANARGWPELVLTPTTASAAWRYGPAAARRRPYEIEVRNRRHDGAYRWFLTRAVPVRDGDGRVVAWFGATTDIDDRKRGKRSGAAARAPPPDQERVRAGPRPRGPVAPARRQPRSSGRPSSAGSTPSPGSRPCCGRTTARPPICGPWPRPRSSPTAPPVACVSTVRPWSCRRRSRGISASCSTSSPPTPRSTARCPTATVASGSPGPSRRGLAAGGSCWIGPSAADPRSRRRAGTVSAAP